MVEGHLNPGLFNHELFNPRLFNHEVLNLPQGPKGGQLLNLIYIPTYVVTFEVHLKSNSKCRSELRLSWP